MLDIHDKFGLLVAASTPPPKKKTYDKNGVFVCGTILCFTPLRRSSSNLNMATKLSFTIRILTVKNESLQLENQFVVSVSSRFCILRVH